MLKRGEVCAFVREIVFDILENVKPRPKPIPDFDDVSFRIEEFNKLNYKFSIRYH